MCSSDLGIVGYVRPFAFVISSPAIPEVEGRTLSVLLDGLGRLEYRGYDSAGVALVGPSGLQVAKAAGKLENLRAAIAAEPPAPATANFIILGIRVGSRSIFVPSSFALFLNGDGLSFA